MIDFEEIEKYAFEHHIPIIKPDTKALLQTTIEGKNPKRILEIGTAIGYSALIMLEVCPKTHIDTLEISEDMYKIATRNLNGKNAKIYLCDCINWVKDNQNQKYEFIFLDGPKGQYLKLYPLLLNMLRSGGVMFCDDVLMFQDTVSEDGFIPHKKRTIINNLRLFLDKIKRMRIRAL